jgi:hypothetical protein
MYCAELLVSRTKYYPFKVCKAWGAAQGTSHVNDRFPVQSTVLKYNYPGVADMIPLCQAHLRHNQESRVYMSSRVLQA